MRRGPWEMENVIGVWLLDEITAKAPSTPKNLFPKFLLSLAALAPLAVLLGLYRRRAAAHATWAWVAGSPPKKTNACRALDARGVSYELRAYDFDEDDLSAETVARKVGLPAEQVFKTLCVRADDQAVLLAVLPGDQVLDLKALARAARKKAVEPVALKELLALTGYVRGGVTALACKKPYPVFVDESAQLFDVISVSAGQRGLQIFVHPERYAGAVAGVFAAIARPKED
jgi:Cys-tRNA(Pro)/Cys-tRNA(Cys) deacylase